MGLRGLVWTASALAQKIVVHVTEGSLGIVEPVVYSSYGPVVLAALSGAVVSAYCCDRSRASTLKCYRPGEAPWVDLEDYV